MDPKQEELVEVIQGLHDELRYRVQKGGHFLFINKLTDEYSIMIGLNYYEDGIFKMTNKGIFLPIALITASISVRSTV